MSKDYFLPSFTQGKNMNNQYCGHYINTPEHWKLTLLWQCIGEVTHVGSVSLLVSPSYTEQSSSDTHVGHSRIDFIIPPADTCLYKIVVSDVKSRSEVHHDVLEESLLQGQHWQLLWSWSHISLGRGLYQQVRFNISTSIIHVSQVRLQFN